MCLYIFSLLVPCLSDEDDILHVELTHTYSKFYDPLFGFEPKTKYSILSCKNINLPRRWWPSVQRDETLERKNLTSLHHIRVVCVLLHSFHLSCAQNRNCAKNTLRKKLRIFFALLRLTTVKQLVSFVKSIHEVARKIVKF